MIPPAFKRRLIIDDIFDCARHPACDLSSLRSFSFASLAHAIKDRIAQFILSDAAGGAEGGGRLALRLLRSRGTNYPTACETQNNYPQGVTRYFSPVFIWR